MKKKIQIFFLTSIFLLLTRIYYAQDYRYYIQTPNGADVPDTYKTDEFSNPTYWRPYWDNYYLQTYPNATQIKLSGEQYSTTRTFNCHGYAWWYVETSERLWIGYSTPGSEEVFWNDGSYVATTEAQCTKISYSGDHSATPSGTANYYISKWGAMPLMYHHKDYTPGYGSANQFFKRATPQPPVISYFTQNPDPLYNGGTGYVYAHLSQGTGNITYTWSVSYYPAMTMQLTPLNDRCQIHYYVPYNTYIGIYITCTASNAYGSDTKTYSLNWQFYNYYRTPNLAFEANGVLTDENPILISSLDNPGVDVTDYYLINDRTLTANKFNNITEESVKFIIHQPDKSKGMTQLNQVELWKVKANKNEFIAVTDQGEVISYKKQEKPDQVTLNDTLDVTKLLSEKDNHVLQIKKGDRIKIKQVEKRSYGEEIYSVFYGQSIYKEESELPVESKKEYLLNRLYLRTNPTIVSKKLNKYPIEGTELKFTEDLLIDYFAIVGNEKTAKVERLKLLEAVNKEKADVKGILSGIDADYSKIYPGEKVDFIFENKNNSDETDAYILKTVGRYEEEKSLSMNTIESKVESKELSSIPSETKLIGNYPNPFNPLTQLSYQLQENTFVELVVINSLGQQVEKLVSSYKESGYYSVSFDGSKLASGIYFYRLQAGNKVFTKKMILMK